MSIAVAETASARWRYRTGVLACGLALLLSVRLVALWFNATELFFDEAQYWSWSLEPALGYYSKPPLIAWVIALTTAACGPGEFCVRLAAPLMHTATAFTVFLIGRLLVGPAVGTLSALVFATLPGVSFSSGIISTDVPLLLCWAVALYAFIVLVDTDDWWPAPLLGAALGLGMNAKYAMAFFAICAAVYILVTPPARRLLRDPRLYAAIGIGILLIAPNMVWNASHSFATFAHTADNAKWGGTLLNIGKGLEFVAAQFAVFGPILFTMLGLITLQAWREGLPKAERLLLAFTVPVLLLITAQAFVSRAHANWAATAYVAGSVLVTSFLMRMAAERWLNASLGLHVAVLLALATAMAGAGTLRIPVIGDPFTRVLGWRTLADDVARTLATARAAGRPFHAVITDERSTTAELIYYMRHEPTPVLAWRDAGRPRDHYELTRPYRADGAAPVLLVSQRADASAITARFEQVERLTDTGPPRRLRLYALQGFQPQ